MGGDKINLQKVIRGRGRREIGEKRMVGHFIHPIHLLVQWEGSGEKFTYWYSEAVLTGRGEKGFVGRSLSPGGEKCVS